MSLRLTAASAGALLGVSTLLMAAVPAQAAEDAEAPVPVAHRGASAYAPENTLAAADKARELGIEWVENDVQRTKDGELVVVHDTTLSRTTNVEEVFPGRAPWKVSDFTAAEIAQLDAGSWFGTAYKGEKIPTLEQFLGKMTANRQKLLLEIKAPELYPGIEAEILKELSNEGWLDRSHINGKLIVQSFGAASVEKIHQLAPGVKTGFLGTPAIADLPKYAKFSDQINPYHRDASPEYIKAVHAVKGAHGKPLEVFTWTVDDPTIAKQVAAAGVNGIITNKPDVIRTAVGG